MAHIHDILSEITQFLNGRDHSCSERFRSLADDYAAACNDVIESLEECRKLIASGNAAQALTLNRQASPMLTERARFLMFPGRPHWLELCVLYKVPFPPEFDMQLIEQLESKELSESIEQISDLTSQWHVLGHTGTNHEKIVLLRKLIQKDKSTKIWRKNLEIAEKAWCRELLNNAAAAQKIKDYACLDSIVIQLNSPELLHPVQPSLLEPFQKDLRTYRTALMQKKQEQVLSEIMNAYNLEDIDVLGTALKTWACMSEEPLFTAPNSKDADILKKAQEHYRQKTEQIMRQNKSKELHAEMNAQIGACETFPKIRATMFRLKELSLPIDPDLEIRYKALEDEYILNQKRKAGIKRLLWCSGIVIFCIAVICTVLFVNRMTAVRNICSEMQTYLENRKPQDAIAYYNELKKQNNSLIENEMIQSLYNQAAALQKQYEKEIIIFDKLLSEIRKKLAQKDIDHTEQLLMKARNGNIYHTSQQDEALLVLNVQLKDLQRDHQNIRNKEFENQFNQIRTESKNFVRLLKTPEHLNAEEIQRQYESIQNRQKELLSNRLHASPVMLESKKEILENMHQLLQDQKKCFDEYTVLKRKLYAPESIDSYFDLLKSISNLKVYSKDLTASFAEALQQKDLTMQYLTANTGTAAVSTGNSKHPYLKDLCMINPSAKIMDEIRLQIAQLRKGCAAKWDLHEIVLESNGKKIFLYLQSPLSDENLRVYRAHGRAGGAFRDVRMNICTGNGQQELIFKITQKSKGFYDLTKVNEADGIPKQLTGVPRIQLLNWTSKMNIDKAQHYTLFNNTLDRLSKITDAASLRDQIVNEIRDYISENKMNPAAKLLIIQNLMKLYGNISELDFNFIEQVRQQCNFSYIDPLDYRADPSKPLDKLRYFNSSAFQKLLSSRRATVQLYQNILSTMSPNAAGIIYRSGKEYWVHFFEGTKQEKMYFVCLKDEEDYSFYLLSSKMIGQGKHPVDKLPASLQNIYNGTVLFVPSGLLNQKDLQRRSQNVFSLPFSIPVFTQGIK